MQKEDAYKRVIPALKPDVIVVMNSDQDTDKGPSDPKKRPIDPLLRTTTMRSLAALTAGGRDVVVLEPNPTPPPTMEAPLSCLESAKWLEDCRYIANTKPSWYELLTRQRDRASKQIWSADFDRLVCPYYPICDPVVGGIVVKWDGKHLTTRFSKTLADPIAAYLRDQDLIAK